jgi:hypothetical protein
MVRVTIYTCGLPLATMTPPYTEIQRHTLYILYTHTAPATVKMQWIAGFSVQNGVEERWLEAEGKGTGRQTGMPPAETGIGSQVYMETQ